MNFADFAGLCRDLERTPSRLAKIAAAAEYLRRLKSDEIRPAVAFLSGRPFQASDPRTLDIGAGAFAHIAGVPPTQSAVFPRLTIIDVAESFAAIAEASGKGSREQKYARLRELVEMTSAEERPILFRLLNNELRIGLHDGLIQEAIARACGSDLKTVRRAALFLSDLAEVAAVALTEGAESLGEVDIKLFGSYDQCTGNCRDRAP
jgi:DNA ligase-1